MSAEIVDVCLATDSWFGNHKVRSLLWVWSCQCLQDLHIFRYFPCLLSNSHSHDLPHYGQKKSIVKFWFVRLALILQKEGSTCNTISETAKFLRPLLTAPHPASKVQWVPASSASHFPRPQSFFKLLRGLKYLLLWQHHMFSQDSNGISCLPLAIYQHHRQ